MPHKKFPFGRKERLKSRKLIASIFQEKQSSGAYPLRFFWQCLPPDSSSLTSVQVGFSVPKKKFKSAVKRNRIKRLIREAYRLQGSPLLHSFIQEQEIKLIGLWVFVGDSLPDYSEIEKALIKSVNKLMKALKERNNTL